MVTRLIGIACAVGLAANAAWAQNVVFRCVDEAGRAQYTNVQSDTSGRQCQVVQREISVVPPQAAVAPKPAAPAAAAGTAAARPVPGPLAGTNPNYPKVDGTIQRGRDDTRRKVLEDELSQEERMLNKAREDLSEQEKIRTGDERNYQRVLDRLKPYQDAVERHAKNIDALRKELTTVR